MKKSFKIKKLPLKNKKSTRILKKDYFLDYEIYTKKGIRGLRISKINTYKTVNFKDLKVILDLFKYICKKNNVDNIIFRTWINPNILNRLGFSVKLIEGTDIYLNNFKKKYNVKKINGYDFNNKKLDFINNKGVHLSIRFTRTPWYIYKLN